MRISALAVVAVLTTFSAPAVAGTSPYSGLEAREIKALSDQEIADLRSGKGMSMALSAELNGYPGPRHVLDLATPLALTPEQVAAVQALFDAMQAEASELGAAVVTGEAELEHAFRGASLDADGLTAKVMAIAELRGKLRAAHLRYHLATRALLGPGQLASYDRLRGYGRGDRSHKHKH